MLILYYCFVIIITIVTKGELEGREWKGEGCGQTLDETIIELKALINKAGFN